MKRLTPPGPFLAIAGLFLIVMIAAGLQGPLIIRPPEDPGRPGTMPSPEPTPSETGMPTPTPTPEPNPIGEVIGRILLVLLIALITAAVVAVLVLIVRALLRAWRDRALPRAEGALNLVGTEATEVAASAEPAVETIQRGIAAALTEIESGRAPSDAIVAAWVGLEESAADAGLQRGRSETPGEFTLRIITRRQGIAGETRTLLRLYEGVRFGGHRASEADRAAAKRALERIEEGWR